MSIERILNKRSGAICELCGHEENLTVYSIQPIQDHRKENGSLFGCNTCLEQIENPEKTE